MTSTERENYLPNKGEGEFEILKALQMQPVASAYAQKRESQGLAAIEPPKMKHHLDEANDDEFWY